MTGKNGVWKVYGAAALVLPNHIEIVPLFWFAGTPLVFPESILMAFIILT